MRCFTYTALASRYVTSRQDLVANAKWIATQIVQCYDAIDPNKILPYTHLIKTLTNVIKNAAISEDVNSDYDCKNASGLYAQVQQALVAKGYL